MDIGIQQLQLGRLLTSQKKSKIALDMIRTIGFDGIELNGFMIRKNPFIVKILTSMSGMTIKNSDRLDWKKLLQETGLKVISLHEDLKTLETDIGLVLDECRRFSTDLVVLTGNYQFVYSDERELKSYCLRLNEIGKKLSEEGIFFLYHNHNAETQRLDSGKLVFEEIISLLDRRYVNFELDTYWFSVSGMDVMKIMGELKDRIILHHICDNGKRKKGVDITPIVKTGEIECGKGCLNLKDMVLQDIRNHTRAVILEQHKNFVDGDVIKSASLSYEYIEKAVSEQNI